MIARARPAGLFVKVSVMLFLLLLLAAAVGVAQAAASSSPAPAETAGDEPLVNWGWLAAGLGGALVLLALMFVLTRFFGSARREDE